MKGRQKRGGSWLVALGAMCLFLSLAFSGVAQNHVDFISTPSEEGARTFHHHLLRPGNLTTYLIQVKNVWDKPATVNLALRTAGPEGFSAQLSENTFSSLPVGSVKFSLLTIKSPASAKAGEVFRATVTAVAEGQYQDDCTVAAEVTDQRKIYFVSIDSLDPAYLKLNAAGTAEGKEGDWLMPNLHRLLQSSVFYPQAKVHIISATDMNHFNYLAGTMTGTAGISLVGGFMFGFDEKGEPIIRNAANLKENIIRYGPEGKPVRSLFNAVKDSHRQAWTAFVSGKNWVPEAYRFPEHRIDRLIHGLRTPDYITPPSARPASPGKFVGRAVRAIFPGPLPKGSHDLGNPGGLKEPQDRREQYPLARIMGTSPENFPSDAWVMETALREIENEDPDLIYILLAAVDDAGHVFGAAHDLSEWDTKGTATVKDDVSKYDPRASRQGILNTVREADAQVGRLLDFLSQRGTLDDIILIAESDHGMVTYFRDPMLDMAGYLKKACPLSQKTDYFVGAAASIGMIVKRREAPAIVEQVEKALEAWRVKNPLTKELECPVVIYNQAEMKTGVDTATGKAWLLPREFYSEYYIEHRKPGEQVWPDLLVLTMPHYKFRVQGFGLGNLGVADLPFKLPEWGYFIGGHGSFETRSCLLMVRVPGKEAGVNEAEVYAMDVAPTIYRLMKWPIPESVDGRGLPGF